MGIDLDIDINESEDELLKILFENPFIKRINDEVTEASLAKWISKQSIIKLEKRIKQRDLLGLITKWSISGIFSQRKVGRTILLQPTSLYFAVKRGEPLCKAPEKSFETSFINLNEKLSFDSNTSRNTTNIEKLIEEDFSVSRNISFHDILLANMEKYDGPNKELINYSPFFFELLCNILNDKYCDWHTKVLISSSLGYFVLEEDVIPDSSENGYVDDLFIICFVLREIKNNNFSKLIEDNWPYKEDILELIEEVYQTSYSIVGDYACEILHKVGIYKFKNLELEEYSGTYNDKLSKIANEKRELLALLAFVIKQLYNVNMNNRSFSKIKEYLMQYGDYDEINRLIELSKLNHDIQKEDDEEKDFSDELEEELRKARLNALLNE
ncbi:YkvA family protein [Methanosarcina mazei]|uniref:YkvA family protein n=1 Tax=Methanosarcina mazei TaxID=2209 RepID=UPI003C70FBCA